MEYVKGWGGWLLDVNDRRSRTTNTADEVRWCRCIDTSDDPGRYPYWNSSKIAAELEVQMSGENGAYIGSAYHVGEV